MLDGPKLILFFTEGCHSKTRDYPSPLKEALQDWTTADSKRVRCRYLGFSMQPTASEVCFEIQHLNFYSPQLL